MENKKLGNWFIRLKPHETRTTAKGLVITNIGDYSAKIAINEVAVSDSDKMESTYVKPN